jgi:hypothetical protein
VAYFTSAPTAIFVAFFAEFAQQLGIAKDNELRPREGSNF